MYLFTCIPTVVSRDANDPFGKSTSFVFTKNYLGENYYFEIKCMEATITSTTGLDVLWNVLILHTLKLD